MNFTAFQFTAIKYRTCIIYPVYRYICLIEVGAMVVAVQHPPPCAVTIHKTCTDQQWNGFHDSARQDQKVDVQANTKHFEVPK